MASPALASVDAASARNGGFGACGEIGSENEAIPGQCRVVVACGNPAPASDGNVRKTAGSPCATSFELISPQYEAGNQAMQRQYLRAKQTGPRGGGRPGDRDRSRRDPFPARARRTQCARMEPSRKGPANACRVVERPLSRSPGLPPPRGP